MIDDQKLLKFYIHLTGRKKEVVELVSRGYSNEQIASRLCVTSKTVAGHLTEIYGNLTEFEEVALLKPNRLLVISLFAPFFERHPDLRNDQIQDGAQVYQPV